ncbi:MAG: hypothetical protein ACI9VR_002647 [Cognaticolwellia sp.]|jgi:hypothetical protein
MLTLLPILVVLACQKEDPDTGSPDVAWECMIPAGEQPAYANQLGCLEDYEVLAAAPLDASIPGARSAKTVIDRSDENTLYFQDSSQYPIHWDFTSANLSGDGLPLVPELSTFNQTEYTSPDRRFLLGALTYYAEPNVWAYEIAPYDTASTEMIRDAFRQIRDNSWIGGELYFHPGSVAVEAQAEDLPDDVPVITTDELFAGIDYQPLNLGETVAQLSFHKAADVDGSFVNPRELVVLDAIPNDISVVAGIITAAFQTPLSHINVLSQNRGTPNMALRGAYENEELLALQGKWVRLNVEANSWSVEEVTLEEADAWWEENRPEPLEIGPMDLSVTQITDTQDILDLDTYTLSEALNLRVPAFGGKATHYGGLSLIPDFPAPPAFAIPVYFYNKHMEDNGLWEVVDVMLADEAFLSDPNVRATQLEALQDAIKAAPVDPELLALLTTKIEEGPYGTTRMRFRSSTNAEDLGSFTGAGLYTSKTGDPSDPDKTIEDAIGKVWASVWGQRAYEERAYWGIDHTQVGMALLCHRSFPDEEANGVAITNNLFDTSGLEPAFYVNVQLGEASVVQPEAGVISDQFLYYFDLPNQPIVYLATSSLMPEGETVLTERQIYDLGVALKQVHTFFAPAYGDSSFYAMDTEFKFDGEDGEEPVLYLKQARPYPGRGE